MAHPRKFRFGVQLAHASSGAAWKELARKAEDLGYSTLFMPDHFGDQLAPVPALQAAADATSTLKVGALVWDNDYKHPVVLAKEAATLDVLSDGRLEFGIGAGWMNTDYEQSGIPKDRDGVRIARMAEALEIYKGLWAPGPYSFSGDHYTITEMEGMPKPVQQPGPPILIGGGGPKVLGIAGRHADIVGINPSIPTGEIGPEAARDAAADRVDQKLQWLKDGAGERFDDLELNALVFVVQVTDDPGPMRQMVAGAFGVDESLIADTPYAWIGSAGEIADQLRRARDRWGFSYFVVQDTGLEAVAPIVAELTGT
ncbi:MAG: TIGR03621 family F420-dependent LLM class oxidoreductase [Actinomycetota bacterium]|nr:TIGR03621 family F420-dependent LLM class oxidoreductase [Actinomycetota bacterium]